MPNPTQTTGSDKPPGARRVLIRQKIDLQFPTFEGLVTEVSANLSTSGMFIQTANPVPVATEFKFGFSIEEWSPIQGRARVVWIREKPEGKERPAGMGVQFVDLDAQSRRMIRWIVDKNLQDGGRPFDLDKVPVGASRVVKQTQVSGDEIQPGGPGPTDIGQDAPQSREFAASIPPEHSRRRRLLVLAVVALLAYWGFRLLRPSPAPAPIPLPVDSAVSPSAQEPSTPVSADSQAGGTISNRQTRRLAPEQEVTDLIQEWAAAWTNRQSDALFALYSPTFKPEGDRQAWQSSVAARMESAAFIRVAVSGLEISDLQPQSAVAIFNCAFRSDGSDEIRSKRMRLERTDDRWLIAAETFDD